MAGGRHVACWEGALPRRAFTAALLKGPLFSGFLKSLGCCKRPRVFQRFPAQDLKSKAKARVAKAGVRAGRQRAIGLIPGVSQGLAICSWAGKAPSSRILLVCA